MASDTRTGVIIGSTANVVRRHGEVVRLLTVPATVTDITKSPHVG